MPAEQNERERETWYALVCVLCFDEVLSVSCGLCRPLDAVFDVTVYFVCRCRSTALSTRQGRAEGKALTQALEMSTEGLHQRLALRVQP